MKDNKNGPEKNRVRGAGVCCWWTVGQFNRYFVLLVSCDQLRESNAPLCLEVVVTSCCDIFSCSTINKNK